jgi:hypothetical protein
VSPGREYKAYQVSLNLEFRQNLSHFGDVFLGNALSPPIAAIESVEKRLPHLPGDIWSWFPVRSTFEPDSEFPLTGKLGCANESPLASFGIAIGPLDFQE